MYEQLKLNNSYRTYLESVLISEHVLRTGIKPTPYQKSYKIIAGTESKVINFQAANKQFSSLSISLVHDSDDQHRSSVAVTTLNWLAQKLRLLNPSNRFSSFNTVKFDEGNKQDKYQLYMQFVT